MENMTALEITLAQVRVAQNKFSTYSQEEVDAIFKAAAIAANQARIPLAKLAVEETGMGLVEDKVIKNHYAAEYIYNTVESFNLKLDDHPSGIEVRELAKHIYITLEQ